jgi:hypothetical protein
MSLSELRNAYHRNLCQKILSVKNGIPNFADSGSKAIVGIAREMIKSFCYPLVRKAPAGQTAGVLFEQITRDFLKDSFALLKHLRPGKWLFDVNTSISGYEQYEHVANLQRMLQERPELASALGGDYLVTPDITVARYPVLDEEINQGTSIVNEAQPICRLTPIRASKPS